MTCHDHSSEHNNEDPETYWTGFGHQRRTVVLCRGCLDALVRIGMAFQPERRRDVARPDRGAVKATGPLTRRLMALA
jgi:hypothetical protein